jgi:hypothetical protein
MLACRRTEHAPALPPLGIGLPKYMPLPHKPLIQLRTVSSSALFSGVPPLGI